MKIYYINETEDDYDTGYTTRVAEEFGYFTDEDAAKAFLVDHRKKELASGYENYVKHIEASNKTASEKYADDKRKHDYMVAGGFPSRAPNIPSRRSTDTFETWCRYSTTFDYEVESLDLNPFKGVG